MTTDPFWIATDLPGRLAIMPRPRSGDWLEDEVASLKSARVDAVVSLLQDDEIAELGLEEEDRLCQAVGIDFLRFPIADRGVPDATELRKFARDLLKRIRSGQSAVVHCRAGIGRSSVVAAAVMIEGGATSAAAFESIAAARGLRVPDTDEQRGWLIAYAGR
jgi:protein-tyrosine phosphatase